MSTSQPANSPVKENDNDPACSQASRRFMELLASGRFKPGESIREANLAKELGINRAAIREALNQLVSIDVMDYTPYCGYRLRPYTLRDMLEWHELRLAMEPMAIQLSIYQPLDFINSKYKEMQEILEKEEECIRKNDWQGSNCCDISLHLKFIEISGNQRMAAVFLQGSLPALAALASASVPTLNTNADATRDRNHPTMSLDSIHKVHTEILNTLMHGTAVEAARMLRRHISCVCHHIRALLVSQAMKQYPSGRQMAKETIAPIISKILDGCSRQ